MDFGNFDKNWKKTPQNQFFGAVLQLSWREKMDFGNFDENWKNRSKIIFFGLSAAFLKGKNGLWKFWWKLKKTLKNHFFGLSAGFLKGKNGLWKICWKLKKSPKNHFFGLSAGFLKGKNGLWKFWWKLKKTLKNEKSFFWPFCSFSEGKKLTLENLLKSEKIAQKSFFLDFLQDFWREEVHLK